MHHAWPRCSVTLIVTELSCNFPFSVLKVVVLLVIRLVMEKQARLKQNHVVLAIGCVTSSVSPFIMHLLSTTCEARHQGTKDEPDEPETFKVVHIIRETGK